MGALATRAAGVYNGAEKAMYPGILPGKRRISMDAIQGLMDFLAASPTAFHAVENIRGMLEAAGMKNVSATKNTVNLAGKEYGGVLLEADTDAGHYYCQQVYFVANGRLGALSLGCFEEDITPSLLELFRPLDA